MNIELFPLDKAIINGTEIKLGMSMEEVAALMGEPEGDSLDYGDEHEKHFYFDGKLISGLLFIYS